MRMSSVNAYSLRSSALMRRLSSAGDTVSRTRPRRSPGDMLNPLGPWRRPSSPLDIIPIPPLLKVAEFGVFFLFYRFTGGILLR